MAGLRDFARLTALLTRVGRIPDHPRPDRRIVERPNLRTPSGMLYDLFEPRGRPEAVVIPVHGATLNGKDDHRLQHFARCLTLSGAACAVPTLPGLSNLEWTPSDLSELADLVRTLHDQTGQSVGLIGFSFAASYSVVTAGLAEVADLIRFVIGIGAYHSFVDLYDHFLATRDRKPDSAQAWDDWIYLHLVIAHRQRAMLDLPISISSEVVALLKRYCYQSGPNEKRAFFERYLRSLDLVSVDHARRKAETLQRLSPKGNLKRVRCKVGLIHDPEDGISPASQAKSLFTELEGLPTGNQHRLVVTRMMNHVNLSGALNIRELYRLFQVLYPLVGA